MLMAYAAPSSARARSVVASMAGLAPSVDATRRATASDSRSRPSSMSKSVSRHPDSSGYDRMSPIRFLAKTVLPAPSIVIFGLIMGALPEECVHFFVGLGQLGLRVGLPEEHRVEDRL